MAPCAAAGASRGCSGWRRRSSGSRSFTEALSSWPSTCSFELTAQASATRPARRSTRPIAGSPPPQSGWGFRLYRTTGSSAVLQASNSRRFNPAVRQRDPQRHRMYPFGRCRCPGVLSATKRSCITGPFQDGASGTRTPDLLGAIQALSRIELGCFTGVCGSPPTSSCDQLPSDYQGISGYLVTGFASFDQIRDRR